MNSNEQLSSFPSDRKATEPKNGLSMMACSLNCVFKFKTQNVEHLNTFLLHVDDFRNMKDLILEHAKLNHLPSTFTLHIENVIDMNLEEIKLSLLPVNVNHLLKLQHLNIPHNCLKVLADEIGILTKLQILRLENNNLIELPDSVCQLVNLQTLSIANNNLRTLPDDIGRLKKLEKFDVSSNMLEDLPCSMFELTNLCQFNASSNMLSYLPEGFTHLNKLTSLNISQNSIYEVPYCLFTGLPSISYLDLSYNHIEKFNEMPNCASKLKVLKLNHNNLFILPRWIFGDICKHLLEINVSYNKYMAGISSEIFISASNLKLLNFSNCSLSPRSVNFLRGLRSLECLNMGNKRDMMKYNGIDPSTGNVFWELPMNELRNSYNLQNLALCSVGLSVLPEDISQLKTLQHLDLSLNSLTWLPDTFCDLEMLKTCCLSNNDLAFLPTHIGKLAALTELSLNGNKLYSVPDSISGLIELEYLDLYGNIFEEMPVVLKNLPKLKGLDLGFNCFDVQESLQDDKFLERYINMRCSIRSRVVESAPQRIDCKRSMDCDIHSVSDEASSSLLSEETEKEERNCPNYNVGLNKEEEENWDLSDEFSDSFDPTDVPRSSQTSEVLFLCSKKTDSGISTSVLPPPPKNEVRHRRALLVAESLVSSRDNFCPMDFHVPSVKNWRSSRHNSTIAHQLVEGQFDDA